MNDEPKAPGATHVRIAGIEARTAIAVALVGALASVGTVAVTRYFDNSGPPQVQHWLRIKGLDGPDGARVRVVAHVDDVSFAYPTLAAWTEVGPNLTEGVFPLPLSGGEHRIRFTIEALDGTPATDYISQKIDSRRASSEVFTYVVNGVRKTRSGTERINTGSTRGASVSVSQLGVRYMITKN